MQHIFLVAGLWISDGVLTQPQPFPLQPNIDAARRSRSGRRRQGSPRRAATSSRAVRSRSKPTTASIFLTGVVDTEDTRREAGRLAWRTDGVGRVLNFLAVGERSVGTWVEDVMISSKIKGKILVETEIYAEDIDVSVVERRGQPDRPGALRPRCGTRSSACRARPRTSSRSTTS